MSSVTAGLGTCSRLIILVAAVLVVIQPSPATAAEEDTQPAAAGAPEETSGEEAAGADIQEGEEQTTAALSDNARAALRRGDCRGLMAALEGRLDPASQLHRVRCGADAELLQALLGREDVLGTYARLLRARTLRETEPEAVAPLLEGLDLLRARKGRPGQ